MCHSWSYVACGGLKDEQYDELTKLTTQVENLSYYCNLNQCTVAHRKILHECLSQVTQDKDLPSMKSLQAEQLNLNRLISEVSTKIDSLQSQNATLKSQIQSTSETFTKVSSSKSSTTPEPPALSANSIANEFADRKRREDNVIVYSLPELSDKSNDQSQFTDLCNTVFGIKVAIIKSIRLGNYASDKTKA